MLSLEGHELGGCKLIRKLGEGGMGVVYLGEELDAGNRLVALKVVRAGDASFASAESREVVRRFEREAALLATLSHPNILPIYGSGVEGDYLYIVMLYAQEGSLSDAIYGRSRLKLGLPVALDRAVDIISQVASALQYCHDRGIVHRDVKPANVLIRIEPGGHWRMLLADFGVARPEQASTARTVVTGTFAYMAPEQFAGDFSPASDQYALAVMAYQLLAGRVPFEGDLLAISRAHMSEEPPPIGAFNASVPPSVEAVIRRGLAKDPAQRYSSVALFAEALRAVASGVPYEASPGFGEMAAVGARGMASSGVRGGATYAAGGPSAMSRTGGGGGRPSRPPRGASWPVDPIGPGGSSPRRRNAALPLLIAALAVLLLVIGVLAAPGLLNAHAQALRAQQTATAQTAAAGTASAAAQTGATPSASASVTQTVSTTPSPQPTATANLNVPTATATSSVGTDQGAPPPAPSGVGSMNFSDPAPTCDFPSGPSWAPVQHPRTTCVQNSSAVTVAPTISGRMACIQQRNPGPGDGYADVLSSSDAQEVTLSFRQGPSSAVQTPVPGYFFTVLPGSNSYTLAAGDTHGTLKTLTSGTLPENLAAHFALGAKYDGATITLYVNGVQIDQTTDSTYSSGSVALCSSSSATFKDVQVYSLSS